MQQVQLIVTGACKEPYLRDACREYEKRLTRFCSLKTIELEPVHLSANPTPREITSALEKEATAIQKHLHGYIVALCIEGKMLDSPALSNVIKNAAETVDNGAISFLIGSSYGLSDSLKSRANLRLSMSPMTFPHQLARVMLLEQIYRSYQILAGARYHK